jgi:sialidase-1
MTIRLSRDGGRTWPIAKVLHGVPAAYSDLVLLPGGEIGCLYERGRGHSYEKLTFARYSLDWLIAEAK